MILTPPNIAVLFITSPWRVQKRRLLDHNTQLSGLKSRLENAEAECRRLTKLHENAER
ncbi:hypothetical protein FOZ62_015707, partial [Perkinsus olseni]